MAARMVLLSHFDGRRQYGRGGDRHGRADRARRGNTETIVQLCAAACRRWDMGQHLVCTARENAPCCLSSRQMPLPRFGDRRPDEGQRNAEVQGVDCVRIVHLIRHSLAFVSYKDRKAVAAALKKIYKAKDADTGLAELDGFADGPWGQKYPAIAQSWRRNWPEVIPFFAFPDDVRRIIYTTNAIESLNAKLRRAVRTRGHFPTDESALKLLFLVLNLAAKEWKMPPREWSMAKAQLAILFEGRFSLA